MCLKVRKYFEHISKALIIKINNVRSFFSLICQCHISQLEKHQSLVTITVIKQFVCYFIFKQDDLFFKVRPNTRKQAMFCYAL